MNQLVDTYLGTVEKIGFWKEVPKSQIIHALESGYRREILKDWFIDDVVFKDATCSDALINWKPRFRSLTDEQINEKYGSNYDGSSIKEESNNSDNWDTNNFVSIDGENFKCDCGSNMFAKHKTIKNRYQCQGCSTIYFGK